MQQEQQGRDRQQLVALNITSYKLTIHRKQ